MSDKAARKKQYILDTAKTVFAKKGFKNVTMKDIVEACDISRGGLYIYFDSTEAIFLECLKQSDTSVADPLKGHSAGDALVMFLNELKKEILTKDNDLSAAVYEYLFLKYSDGASSDYFKERYDAKVKILTGILEEGSESGDLYCEDCALTARNIMYTMEGLKVGAATFGVTEKEVDMHLLYILSGLIVEE